jgi:hypothetical protein
MEKKVIEIEVKDNSKTLKQQYKEAVLEVQKLADAFGATSIEVQNASKRAAELKDQIEDVNDAIQAQKGEGAFIALGKSLSTVASGFSAVEGAMGLVGAESEDVQKAMLRVQSAMALAQGLEGLEDAGRAFKQLGAVVKSTTVYTTLYNFVMGVSNKETATNVALTEADTTAKVGLTGATGGLATVTGGATTAMKLFRVALIATGIGAIVVLVGLLIANFDKVTKVVTTLSGYVIKAYDYFDNLGTAIKVLIGIFFPFIGVVYGAIKALEYFNIIDTKTERDMSARHIANMKRIDKSLDKQEQQRKAKEKAYNEEDKALGRQIALLEAQGKSSDALVEKRLRNSIAYQKALLEELQLNQRILRATNTMGVNNDLIEENAKAIIDTIESIKDARNQLAINDAEINKKRVEDAKKTDNELYIIDDSELKRREAQRKMDAENLALYLGDTSMAEIKSAKEGIQLLSTTRTTELEIEKNTADRKIEIQRALFQQKKDLQQQDLEMALQGVGIIKSIFEKSKGVQKAAVLAESAIGIAKIVTSTQAANAAAIAKYSLIPGGQALSAAEIARNKIGAGLGIASNLVATGKALQSLGGGSAPSGGGDLGGIGGGGVISPNLNVVGNTGINQLATLQQQPVKAYVVSNDITSAQQFDLKVQQTSQL